MVAGAALRRPRCARVFWDPGRQVHQDQRWGYAEDRYRLPGVIARRDLMGGKMCTLRDSNADRLASHASVNKTILTEVFEAEHENTFELQQAGWQAILDNFKKYVEASEKEK